MKKFLNFGFGEECLGVRVNYKGFWSSKCKLWGRRTRRHFRKIGFIEFANRTLKMLPVSGIR